MMIIFTQQHQFQYTGVKLIVLWTLKRVLPRVSELSPDGLTTFCCNVFFTDALHQHDWNPQTSGRLIEKYANM